MIKWTKKEREQRAKTHAYIRNYKPRRKKKIIQVTVTTKGRERVIIASGYNKVSVAKKYVNKIKGHKDLKKLGYSNPRIKVIKVIKRK